MVWRPSVWCNGVTPARGRIETWSEVRLLVSALSCNPSLGSEALVGFKFVEALARRHEVVVFASPPSQTPDGVTLVACDAGECSFNEVDAVPLLRFEWRQWRMARRLRFRHSFDFVHRLTPSAIQVPTWAHRLGRPLVLGPLIAADRPPAAFADYWQRPVSRPQSSRWHPARVAARFCGMIVNRAARRGDHLRRAYRILVGSRIALRHVPEPLREKCRVVTYAGVEHDVFVPRTLTLDPSPNRIGREEPIRLLFVGRLVPYKGVELLLRALAVAAKKCSFHLDIVGSADPVYKDFLIQLARELGLGVHDEQLSTLNPQPAQPLTLPSPHPMGRGCPEDGRGANLSTLNPQLSTVSFLPPVPRDQLPALYQQADVFCFPTICDTYGIALLEAMSCGCAVLVSDVAGAGEIVNGENGLKVPLQEPDQYIADCAEKLAALAQQPELRSRLGAEARRYILREHDWGRVGDQVLAVYDEMHRS